MASAFPFLLPLREKVARVAGRMRGRAGHAVDFAATRLGGGKPLIRRFAPPSPARGEGTLRAAP